MHRQNLERQEQELKRRNNLDYRAGKKVLKEGESKKKVESMEERIERRERYLTLNERK